MGSEQEECLSVARNRRPLKVYSKTNWKNFWLSQHRMSIPPWNYIGQNKLQLSLLIRGSLGVQPVLTEKQL